MSPRKAGCILTPGAGADRDQGTLVAVDQALSAENVVVDRVDFPYRQAGRKAPDRAPVLVETIVEASNELRRRTRVAGTKIFHGGRSMGGRMGSMAVAEGLPSAGLILISYPLHPPGRPDRLRIEHLPAISVPVLFVSGTRDAFGTPAELKRAAKRIAGPVSFVWIEGGDHGLKNHDPEIAGAVVDWVSQNRP